jgi:outer membrane receptor for ferrienterochelin and colicins
LKTKFHFKLRLIIFIFIINVISVKYLFGQRLDSLQTLDELVITGQYEAHSLSKSVLKVKVIDSKRIEKQGAFTLQQVLSNELNIRIIQDPVLGSNMQLQGVGGNNIKILIDGVPVIGRENGSVDLSQINLQNVERIEMVEGPMSVNFGTDALGGVINLITKKQKQTTRTAKIGTYLESIGQYNFDLSLGKANEKYSVIFSGGRNFFSGFSEDPNNRNKLWKPRTQYNGDVSVSKFIKNGSLRWTNQVFLEKVTDRGVPNIDWTQALAIDKYYRTSRVSSSFFYDQKHEGKRNVNFLASYNFYQRRYNTYVKDLVELKEELVPSAFEHDTNWFHQVMSRGTYSNVAFSKKLGYQLGYELNHELSYGSRIEGTKKDMGDYNLFTSAEWKPFKNFLIRPAFRLIYHTRYDAPIVPSINFKYDFSESWILRGSYAKGYRAPSLKELYLQFVDAAHNIKGNQNLEAETSNNLQLVLSYTYKKESRIFRFEPTFFYNHIENMIDFARVGDGNSMQFQYVNINTFSSFGNSLVVEYRTIPYQLSLGYSVTGRRNVLSGYSKTDAIFFNQECRLNVGYSFVKSGLNLSLFTKLNGKLQMYQYNYLNNEVAVSYIDPYAIFDFTLNKSLHKNRITITSGIKNVLNLINVSASLIGGPHSSASSSASTGMGRSVFLGIKYALL